MSAALTPARTIVASLALLAACGGGAEPRGAPAEPLDVVLVVVDTLGAAHLGCAGAPGDFTPNIDRLAREGKRFERAYATAPWTQPSIASLFTSQMPSRHGVQKLAGHLPDEAVTLAERFREAGFRTHAVVSHFLIEPKLGYAQGFESYNTECVAGHEGIVAEHVTDRALAWLAEPRKEPFFLFVHYFDPHFVYHDHPEIALAGEYDGPVRSGMPIWDLRDAREHLGPADVRHLVELYHEEIAFTDRHLGRLFDALAARKRRPLIVFTADHGEELMEHGWIGHTNSLKDVLLRVPLIVDLPGRVVPGVVSTPVSLLDVFPTIAELALGVAPDPRWEGVSFAGELGERPAGLRARPLFAEVAFEPVDRSPKAAENSAFQRAVVEEGWKLIHDLRAERFELYDTASDPEERVDRWGEDPARDARLRELLLDWERTESEAGDAHELDPDQLEELDKLGYGRSEG